MNMEKRKIKFNFVDVIILVLIILAFIVGYKFINKSADVSSDMPEVSFTVEVTNVENDYKDNFSIGDEVRDAIKGDMLGVITGIEAKPATVLTENSIDGTYELGKYEGREDVYVTIKGTSTSFGANVIIAQQEIKVGNKMYFKKPGCVGRGYIVKMNIEEAANND